MRNSLEEHRTLDLYKYFIGAYRSRTLLMVVLMVLAGLAEGIGVITIIPVLQFADQSQPPQGGVGGAIITVLGYLHLPPTLEILLIVIVLTITMKAVFLFFAGRQIGFTVAGVVRDLRLQLMRAFFDVRWTFFQKQTSGQIVNSVMHEANASAAAYSEACRILAAAIQMLAYVAVATAISWQVSLAGIGAGAGIMIVGQRFIGQSRSAGRAEAIGLRSLSSRLVDMFGGIKALKAMGRQDLVWPLVEYEVEALNRASRSSIRATETLRAFQEPIVTLILAVGLFLALRVAGQPLSTVLVMAFILFRVISNINTIQMRYQFVVKGESAFFSLWSSLRRAEDNREPDGGGRPFTGIKQGIRFEHIHFAYDDHEVLKGVDVEIPIGSFVAILGGSGAGKTTLVDLLVGLIRPDEGQIVIDDTPLNEFDLTSWRTSLGYVPQEMLLFNQSIFTNVTLGDPAFDRGDAERALRLAGAWDFVEAQPNGLDHEIGERGGQLSGGQRQRIAIARALIGRPELLIMDEVTAALDPTTEQAICETLRSLAGQVTILSISHQPAMQAAADTAYLLSGGRLEPSLQESVGTAGRSG
jgi:ATP-binding cassette subfamily C protein